MSHYDYDRKISFITIAIGDEYIEKVNILIQSVLKFTNADIIVYTDKLESFTYAKHYYGRNLIVNDVTTLDGYVDFINGIFNYHLKAIVMYDAYAYLKSNLIYVDADTFLFGWDASMSRYIMGYEDTLLFRFRENVNENVNLINFLTPKAQAHGVNLEDIDKPLAVENIMVFTTGELTQKFLNEWKHISLFAIENNINPFIESFELALAIKNVNMNIHNVNSRVPFVDSFRTLHQGKIIATYII